MRIVVYLLLAIIFASLQSTVGNFIRILGAAPNFLLAMVICVSLLRGSVEGGFVGVICGLLMDFLSMTLIGFYAIVYLYIGVICGLLCTNLYRDKLVLAIAFSIPAALISSLLYFVFMFLMWGYNDYYSAVLRHILPESMYVVICILPIFYLFKIINKYFLLREGEKTV